MLNRQKSLRIRLAAIALVLFTSFTFASTPGAYDWLGFAKPLAENVVSGKNNQSLSPQTVVLSDDFEGATTFVAANSTVNAWVIGTAAANGGTQGAYISNTAGATNAYSNTTTTAANHFYAPITVPAGETAVVLSFDWRTIADYDATVDFDYLRVSVRSTIPVAGTMTALAEQIPVTFSGQDNYTKAYVNLPASVATGTTQYLVFTWVNDSSVGTLPAAIDNVLITSLAPSPLSGTKTIPGDYSSIGEAIANVNAHGADTSGGSLTFNVAAGSTFTETPFPLTTSGSSATNRIIFQKSGAGANPKVLAEGGGNFGAPSSGSVTSSSDAIIALNGVDFTTFDGIDVQSISPSGANPFTKVEYGYLLRNNNILANVTTINGSQNNIIQNTSVTLDRRKTSPVICIGIMQSASTATGAGSAATSAAQSNSGNKYYNLTISNVGAGIYLLGTAAFPDDLTEVGTTSPTSFNSIGAATANDIANTTATTWGIRFASQSNAKVFNNEIRNITHTSTGTATGIHLDNAGTVTAVSLGTTEIYRNNIHDIAATTSTTSGIVYGIRANLTGNAGSVARIQNNFISALNSSSTSTTSIRLMGINVQDAGVGTGATFNVHNNSVRIAMTNLATISAGFVWGATGATNPIYNVRNNIFANVTGAQAGLAKHYAIVSSSNTTIGAAGTVSDVNDLYVTGANGFVGRGSTTDFLDLTAWQGMQAGAGPDDASFSVDPMFTSATDLHLTGASTLINIGTTIATVTDDIDAQARPNGAGYEIGADEFVPAPGILQLSSTTYSGSEGGTATPTVSRVSGSSGTVGVTYTLTDGTATGGAACTAGVDYINPGPTAVSLGDTVTSFPISVTLCTDAELEGPQAFTITLSLPTGGATLGSPTVATVTITDVAPPFSGSYNVGSGEILTSLTNAGGIFDAINTAGATGPVTINITSDLTGETGAVALNPIAGSPTVLIKPSGGVRTISGVAPIAVIRFNGSDNIRLDGSTAAALFDGLKEDGNVESVVGGTPALRELTVRNDSTSTTSAVIAMHANTDGAQNNTIQNVNVDGNAPTTTLLGISIGGAAPGSAGADNDGNDLINNRVRRSFFGIYSAGASLANQNTGTVINQNDLSATGADNIAKGGIIVFNENGIQITENSIGGILTTLGTDTFGIGLGAGAADGQISTTATTAGGITNAMVARNRINGVNSAGLVGFAAVGIAVAGDVGGVNTIANNMITGVTAPSTSPDFPAGIFVAGVTGSSTRIYYNSIAMTGDRDPLGSLTQMPSFGIAITGTDPTVELKNNIFYTTQTSSDGGAGAESYAIGMVTTTFVNLDSNFNDFWSTGANDGGFRTGSLGLAAGTDHTALSDWTTATGDDASPDSMEADPLFISPLTNLHLSTLASPVYDQGIAVSVLDDHDAQIRSVVGFAGGVPDIGADEILVPLAATVNVGGRVTTASGQGIPRARMTLTDSLGNTRRVQTGSFGYYNFENVDSVQVVTISVAHKQYIFSQPTQIFNVVDNITDADFISSGVNNNLLNAEETYFDRAPFDFDGDGRTDMSVRRGGQSTWLINRSSDNTWSGQNFGLPSDVLAPADYDGDGRTDFAVFRASEGTWFILNSSGNNLRVESLGLVGDIPCPIDGDGDRSADPIVWRASTQSWLIKTSDGRTAEIQVEATDKTSVPLVADYDTDGLADLTIYIKSSGTWRIRLSSTGETVEVKFGGGRGAATMGDFDGDARADLAIYNDGIWRIRNSRTGEIRLIEAGTGVPVPGDYDGDGRLDTANFDGGRWTIRQSASGFMTIREFGLPTDTGLPSIFVR